MALETAFYIIGIIFMGLMLAILAALTVAVLVIRAKIVAIERAIADKLHGVTDMTSKVAEIFHATKNMLGKRN